MIINAQKLVSSFQLDKNEMFCLYLLRDDGWPFGYLDSYRNADELAKHIELSVANPDVIGVWVTKESNDGQTDITIFKMMEGRQYLESYV